MTKKKQNGITLIALVISIIVLLILAGVSIMTLAGDNGLLTRTTTAKQKTEEAGVIENIRLAYQNAKIGSHTKLEHDFKKDMKDYLEEIYGEGNVEVEDGENQDVGKYVITILEKKYTIDANGIIEKAGAVIEIEELKIVESSDGTGEEIVEKQEEGKELYISFKINIVNGIIKRVICNNGEVNERNGRYVTKITKNGKYIFSATGTNDRDDTEVIHEVNVDKYSKRANLHVGDYINYVPDNVTTPYSKDKLSSSITGSSENSLNISQDSLDWQILRIYDDDRIDLIGSPTTYKVSFQGPLGYNNGIYVMNDICKNLYSKESKGISARSIKQEDIEYYLTEKGISSKENTGSVRTWTTDYYPDLYKYEIGSGIGTTTVTNEGIGMSDTYSGYANGLTSNTKSRARGKWINR